MIINLFGVIPKRGQPGKWRLIVDLSHPQGTSVNDGISRESCTMHYVSVDDAVKHIASRAGSRGKNGEGGHTARLQKRACAS